VNLGSYILSSEKFQQHYTNENRDSLPLVAALLFVTNSWPVLGRSRMLNTKKVTR